MTVCDRSPKVAEQVAEVTVETDCQKLVAVMALVAAKLVEALVAPVAARCCFLYQRPCHLPCQRRCRHALFLALVPVTLVVQDLLVDSVASKAAAQVAALVELVVQEETAMRPLH